MKIADQILGQISIFMLFAYPPSLSEKFRNFTNYQFLNLDLDWSLTILCKYWTDSVKILDKCCANIGQILGKYWANIGLIMCKYWENIVQIPLWKSRDLLKLQCSLKDTDTQFLNFHLRDWLTDIPSSGDAYASKKEISVQLVLVVFGF